jgi:hypothetical protein
MATKAFYRAKKDHMRPMRNVYERAVRALESGVPVGRGHPWQLAPEPGDTKRKFPNWKNHSWTKSVALALKDNPPAGFGIRRDRTSLKEWTVRHEPLLEKFLKRHPEVMWKVPYNAFSDQDWAPAQFAKRWEALKYKEKLGEEEAYQRVVQEGSGDADWNGIWNTLEHDPIKSIIKAESMHLPAAQRKASGISLLRAYQEAKHMDAKAGVRKAIWGLHKAPRSRVEKLLEAKAASTAEKTFTKDLMDLGVLFKVRAIQAKRSAADTKHE